MCCWIRVMEKNTCGRQTCLGILCSSKLESVSEFHCLSDFITVHVSSNLFLWLETKVNHKRQESINHLLGYFRKRSSKIMGFWIIFVAILVVVVSLFVGMVFLFPCSSRWFSFSC